MITIEDIFYKFVQDISKDFQITQVIDYGPNLQNIYKNLQLDIVYLEDAKHNIYKMCDGKVEINKSYNVKLLNLNKI